MLGMVKYKQPLLSTRQSIVDFVTTIESNPFFNTIPSIKKRIEKGGLYLHAKDDPPELRYKVFEFMRTEVNFTLQVIVGRKELGRFVSKHNRQEREFYADLLSRMLHDKGNHSKLVLNIADRGSSTRIQNLEAATAKAEELYLKKQPHGHYDVKVQFNVQPYRQEPLLTIADYGLWAVQRVFEKGEARFYDTIMPKVRFVVDAYDPEHYKHGNDRIRHDTPLPIKIN